MKLMAALCLAVLSLGCALSETTSPPDRPLAVSCVPQACSAAITTCQWTADGCGGSRLCGACDYTSCPNGLGFDPAGNPIPCTPTKGDPF